MIYTIKMIGDLIFKVNERRGFPQECYSRTPKNEYFEVIEGTGYVSNGTHYLEKNMTGYSLVAMTMENGRTGVCSLKSGTKKEIYGYLTKILYRE